MSRYNKMFASLTKANEIAFIPFTVLGYPDMETSYRVIKILIENGADALELGIPFSDPVADGPIIQKASTHALVAGGITPKDCLEIVKKVRGEYPDLPIGLLVYANLVVSNGEEVFFKALKAVGVDSILIADVPTIEAHPFRALARKNGLDYINVLPPDINVETLTEITQTGMGYTYLLGRKGVTGTGEAPILPNSHLLKLLSENGCPPPVQGFGVSDPSHVMAAQRGGARGVICGSKIVSLINEGLEKKDDGFEELIQFLIAMKRVTKANQQAA